MLVEHDTAEKCRGLGTRREVDRRGGGWPGSATACVADVDGRLPEEFPRPRADAVVGLQEEFVVPVDMGDDSGVQELAEFTREGLVEFCCPAAPLVDVAEVALNLERQSRGARPRFPALPALYPGSRRGGRWSSVSLSSGIENAS